jgi:hypothetical protein
MTEVPLQQPWGERKTGGAEIATIIFFLNHHNLCCKHKITLNSKKWKRCMKPNSVLSYLLDFPALDWEGDCFLETPRAACSSGISSKPRSSIVSCCDVGPPRIKQINGYLITF